MMVSFLFSCRYWPVSKGYDRVDLRWSSHLPIVKPFGSFVISIVGNVSFDSSCDWLAGARSSSALRSRWDGREPRPHARWPAREGAAGMWIGSVDEGSL